MSKRNDDQNQDNTEVQAQPEDPNADQEQDKNRVVNNGDVSDPGNSGLIGDAFTEGSVTGNADKPNG